MDSKMSALHRLKISEYMPMGVQPSKNHLDRFNQKEFNDHVDVAELFHENTKLHSDSVRPSENESVELFSTDPALEYAQAKLRPEYEGRERIVLPSPGELEADLGDVLERRRSGRSYAGASLSMDELSTLLHHSCGVTAERPVDTGGIDASTVTQEHRSYPSPGALYPVEPYVLVVNGNDDLERGLYYYVPETHELRVLRRTPSTEVTDLFPASGPIEHERAAITLFLTGAFWRAKAKYGPLGHRFVLQESGHLAQNVQLVAQALGLASVPIGGFYADTTDEFLNVNGVDESTVYTVSVGVPDRGDRDD